MNLTDGAAIVTGGASGLGLATALALARRGMAVTIADLAEPAHDGSPLNFVRTDVTDADQVSAAVIAAAELGELRVAVACAGIGATMRTVDREGVAHKPRVFEKVMDVNLRGTFHVLSEAAAQMQRASSPLGDGGRGVIVTTASIAAFDGQIGQVAYSASKAAIAGMTLPAARDLGPAGIRVVCVAPGAMSTPLLGKLSAEQQEGLVREAAWPRRLGRPEEFASLVCHIAENDYINATTIRIDAGLRMTSR
jgi:NAD(P)-dependent dehydrogenase (short-subunit alcohol dehydrogenase family)